MSLRGMLCTAAGFGLSVALLASGVYDNHRAVPAQDERQASSGLQITISIENDDVILRWNPVDSRFGYRTIYRVYRSQMPVFSLDDAELIAGIDGSFYRDVGIVSRYQQCFYSVEPVEIEQPETLFNPPYPGVTIEDFESFSAVLYSYQNEDLDPNDWEITGAHAYGNSVYSLYLYGNTWKELRLDTSYVLTDETVWQAAFRSHRRGELHAFGVGDSTRVLFYVFRGSQIVNAIEWNVTYHATLSDSVWKPYLFAVGGDWEAAFGDLPMITRLVFVNDNDAGSSHGNTYFDEIIDVTGNVPSPPHVEIIATQNPVTLSEPSIIGIRPSINIGFIGLVTDPDGDLMRVLWDFGDGSTSSEMRPNHTFPRYPNITVSLTATDSLGLVGTDVLTIPISPPNVYGNVSMAFVGDVMMARRYEDTGGIIPTYGANYIFHEVRDLLESFNVAVCNLECPLTLNGYPHPTKEIVFRGRPEYVSALNYAGFEMVSLANNHVWDYMDPGMVETMDVLDSAGILRTGAGMNCILARQPAYITRSGIRIALLGFCNRTGRADNEIPYLEAGMTKGGLAMLSYENLDAMIPYALETADRVFVFLHSGEEYMTAPDVDDLIEDEDSFDHNWERALVLRTEPTDQEQELRRHAIDLGADMVINSHPHVLQGFEVYDGKFIAHSLGNFAFDQYFWETYPSALVETEFDAGNAISEIVIHPIYIDDYIPMPAAGTLGTNILERLMDYSRDLNTTLVFTDSSNSIAKVVIDTALLQETWHDHSVTIALREDVSGVRISEPLPLFDGGASPARIVSVTHGASAVPCSVSLGRDLLWVGGFEDEGSTVWYLNSSYEWLDTQYVHTGEYSLGLVREASTPYNVVTNLEDRFPTSPDRDYSLIGSIQTFNANQASMITMWYRSRSGDNLSRRDTVSTPISGTANWTFQWEHMIPPDDANYVDIRCNLFPPSDGIAYAYFDDLAFIEWETPVSLLPYTTDYPNNLRYLRVFTGQVLDSVTVNYRTVRQWLP